jgi:phosphate transport system substrate-binding protein
MKKIIAAAAIAATFATGVASARTHISVVGSSTVYPFATAVAEAHGRNGFKAPVIESTGSGGGMKIFCKGIGVGTPDFTNSSRKIKKAEVELCKKNGVTPIEHLVGYDGIAFANDLNGVDLNVTTEELYKAMSKRVYLDGKFVDNPFKKWSDINPELPNQEIKILAPPPTSGTRDAFVEIVLHKTCKKEYKMGKKGPDGYKAQCSALREDGHVVIMGENDNLIVQKLRADKETFGIFGFSFLDQNGDIVKSAVVNGKPATFEAIADGSYPISRPLYYYHKKEHVGSIEGMQEYIDMFDRMRKPEGRLEDMGLIPVE